MKIIPAIDIINGNCVRLVKGEYSTAHKVASDPITTALEFENAGTKLLHIVDLDGAKSGRPDNADTVLQIVKSTGLQTEIGGGVRDMQTIEFYINSGISRVILGSAAIKNPELLKTAVKNYGKQIVVGIDAKDGFVKTEGWLDKSNVTFLELAKRVEDMGATEIIYTDISTDGTLQGPNLEHLKQLTAAVGCNVTASGGVGSMEDLNALAQLPLYGIICGKAVYTKDIDLAAAIALYGG
ncbi:MAG: 1-(5-phosphoribosyl)-5-[(5-phosphoribosylamino)methylideneamino]imidazole-4-carboxamide isomerase [Oscillospiraceae bacterium]|nr:1-(5-phosphoribosyl)-5-[(5-phosphoribosylamino)methylideneamino]imidazole-4-carboxamide isomerase [Oscillospiraceae bacterium]